MKEIDKGIRATNYLVDISVICIICLICLIFFGYYFPVFTGFYSIMFFYYLIFELTTGQTLGKMLTKTKVVNKNGKKAGFIKLLVRSLLRIMPIDSMSYLLGCEWGLHDVISSTRIMKSN